MIVIFVLGTWNCLDKSLTSAALASPSCALACKYTVSSPAADSTIFSCELPGLTKTEYIAMLLLYT